MNFAGRVLGGRYDIGRILGQGGWGTVYEAVQRGLGRRVAIKILRSEVAIQGDAFARFEREARAAAALGHPNIVQVIDFQSAPGEPPFLVMELLEGTSLGDLLERERILAPQRVVRIALQMLAALEAAHRAGIVHRDVKPDNVFLVTGPGIRDFVKLLDFGIAKLSAEGVAKLTEPSAMLGSPAFMAPEQVRGAAVDGRTDLYAVGATMYLAMTGKLPFEATSIAAMLYAITEQRVTPASMLDPRIDPGLAAIVDRVMHKDPNARFSSAAEFRAALEPWGDGRMSAPPVGAVSAPPAGGMGTTRVGPAPMGLAGMAPRKSRRWIFVLAAGLLLGVMGAGAATWFSRKDAGGPPAPGAAIASAPSAPPPAMMTTTASATPTASAMPTASATPTAGTHRDASAPVVARKPMGGVRPSIGGGTFGSYDIEASKAALAKVMPQLSACYAATEFEPPDHQFTNWTLTIDPRGNVTGARRTTSFEPHPHLDACVVSALRASKWQALPGGGSPQIALNARTRDNP